MSRSLSATGWSAGGTLLAALVGSLAGSATGVAAVEAGGEAVVAVAASFLLSSALFVSVTTSDGLLAGATADFAVSGKSVVLSSLKSFTVGGGRFAGSGRG